MDRRIGGKLVWSSDPDPVPPCPDCGEPPDRCRCSRRSRAGKSVPPPPGSITARLRIERKGRGGKTVTIIEGLPGPPQALEEAARWLKSACGAGGTVRGSAIEVQGDQRARAAAALESRGYTVKGD